MIPLPGWYIPAALGLALAIAAGGYALERSRHAVTRAKADELGRRVAMLDEALERASAINQRLAADRTTYIQAQAALKARLADQESRARAQEAAIRRAASEATTRDRERRARPDVPPAEEMTDALADAARGL